VQRRPYAYLDGRIARAVSVAGSVRGIRAAWLDRVPGGRPLLQGESGTTLLVTLKRIVLSIRVRDQTIA